MSRRPTDMLTAVRAVHTPTTTTASLSSRAASRPTVPRPSSRRRESGWADRFDPPSAPCGGTTGGVVDAIHSGGAPTGRVRVALDRPTGGGVGRGRLSAQGHTHASGPRFEVLSLLCSCLMGNRCRRQRDSNPVQGRPLCNNVPLPILVVAGNQPNPTRFSLSSFFFCLSL